jgi:hyperosmotically inducible protein
LIFVFSVILNACSTPKGRTTGQVIDDGTITTVVKAKLYGDDFLQGLSIGVKTFNGKVTLTGAVNTAEQKRRARQHAASVNGVVAVNNLLEVKRK